MDITHIWFYTSLSLRKLNEQLGATLDYVDGENYWEWSVSTVDRMRLNITRTHTKAPVDTPTVIYLLDDVSEFSHEQLTLLVEKLKQAGIHPISLGQRKYISGNKYEFILEREI